MRCLKLVVIAGLFCLTHVQAQEISNKPDAQLKLESSLAARADSEKPQIDIDLIMLGERFSGKKPQPMGYSLDQKNFYFRWQLPGEKSRIHLLDLATGEVSVHAKELDAPRLWHQAVKSPDGKYAAYVEQSTLTLLNLNSFKKRILIQSGQNKKILGFHANSDQLAIRIGNDLHVININSGSIAQKTAYGNGKKSKGPVKYKGQRAAIRQAEKKLQRLSR